MEMGEWKQRLGKEKFWIRSRTHTLAETEETNIKGWYDTGGTELV